MMESPKHRAKSTGLAVLRKAMPSVGANVIAAVGSLFVILPLAWILFTSVKSDRDVIHSSLGLPTEWHWENYVNAWGVGHFDRYFMNSIYVVVPTVLLILALSVLTAYAFATMRFPGKELVFSAILVGLTIPLDILIIPLFYSLLDLGLLNTHWALILPISAKILPFGVLLVRGFMEDLPSEILDAGIVDGCTRFGLLRHLVLPLSTPCLSSLLVFSFMWTWNQFILPIVLIQDDSMRTLPVGLNYFQGRYSTDIPLLMAGAAISSLPIVLIYVAFQRQFIKGITVGALK